jgi:hypothetical protein
MRQRSLSEAYAELVQRFVAGGPPMPERRPEADGAPVHNRDSVRHKILKAGQIVYRNASCVMDCTILNISATGACIQPADAFDEPGKFTLKIAHGPTRRCEVRWRSGGKLGVDLILRGCVSGRSLGSPAVRDPSGRLKQFQVERK